MTIQVLIFRLGILQFSSQNYRFVGVINPSPQYIVTKYSGGCVYISRGEGKQVLFGFTSQFNSIVEKDWHDKDVYAASFTDHDFADRIIKDLKRTIELTDVGPSDSCGDFYETHVLGTISFGMTQNIFFDGA